MHQNYYFLRQLAPRLKELLAGKKFVEAFSQDKDELLITFAEGKGKDNFYKPFFIKASLRSDFSGLCFPEQFDRARKNSVDLFTELYDESVIDVRVFRNERAFGVALENGHWLVFKLFGNRSNILHFDETGEVRGLFNNRLGGDADLRFDALDRNLDQSFEAFTVNEFRFEPLFPTFGKLVNRFLNAGIEEVTDPAAKWGKVQEVVAALESPRYFLVEVDFALALTLLPMGEIIRTFDDPVEALNGYYYAYARQSNLSREKSEALKRVQKRITQTENYLKVNYARLLDVGEQGRNEQLANILMANLHQLDERQEKAELYDFYHDRQVMIKLKKELSPQKNAELYYRKAKNEKIELEKLQENITVRESELETLREHLTGIGSAEQLRELRAYLKKQGLIQTKAGPDMTELFKREVFLGYTILIGRNARNNDLLTKQYAYKEDLWLHARDSAGSHVIIKYQAGKKIPAPVVERAAQLAAWYSKRKTDSLCPVIVTPKKYVRKPKGLPDGAVVIDKEEVVLVEPRQ